MSKTLEQILGSVNLTGLIQATTMGLPQVLPPAFMNVTQRVLGNSARYTRVTGTRTTSRLVDYGSPALRRKLKNIGEVDIRMLHTFEEIQLDPLTLQRLRNYSDYGIQQLGMQEVARQIANFRQNFENLRIATCMQVLMTGKIYYDGNGNLLPTSSGAVVTVDFQMNANNQNQLNSIITASWATVGTDIPLQLRNLKKRATRLTGYPLKYAFYAENIPSYLDGNTKVQQYLSRNPTLNYQWLTTGEIPDGLFGLTWVPIYTAFYEDSTGTNQDLFPNADTVVFTPEVSTDWWDYGEGSYQVPVSLDIRPDQFELASAFRTVYGRFGYSVPSHNPPTYTSYVGDTFLPVLKVPDAIYQADVTP